MEKLLVIPHFHYDLAWIEGEMEYLSKAFEIVEYVLELMEVYPNFTYVFDQAYYLKKLKEKKPKLFSKVKEKVKDGRIEIVNGGFVMPDLNLPLPQTIEANLKLARKFALKEFGIEPKVAWLIDCFGHPFYMPRIAERCGIKYYVMWRGINEGVNTQEFLWREGESEIIVHWLKESYVAYGGKFKSLKSLIKRMKPTFNVYFIPFGGDFYKPEEKLIKKVEKEGGKFALPSQFFEFIERKKEELPIIEGEHLSSFKNFFGVYSSRISYKQLLRRLEEISPEKACYGSFHDLACGTVSDKVYKEVMERLGKVEIREGNGWRKIRKLELRTWVELGDLYHSFSILPRKFKEYEAWVRKLNKNEVELKINLNLRQKQRKIDVVIPTGIKDGRLFTIWEGKKFERKIGKSYAFNLPFRYEGKDGSWVEIRSEDCFELKVEENNFVVGLVRGTALLSYGTAAPPHFCPKAWELGKHEFRIRLSSSQNITKLID